jgi:O-acetyl-ADP-ribose deacetylase (regulator of RNase III)
MKNIKGNLLDAKTDVIAHQVNCLGHMGAGIAKQIKTRWPEVYEGYLGFCKKDSDLLGKCMICEDDDGKFRVANLFGQFNHNPSQGRMTNYDALYNSLEHLSRIMKNHNWKSVAFPKNMSSALGGADWRIVEKMIECIFENFEVEIWEYDAR